MLNNLDKDVLNYIWVLIVGIVGGLLGLDSKKPDMNRVTGWRKFVSYASATGSSVFICWEVYELAYYFSTDVKISLAAGGFCAWQGADWVRTRVNRLLDKRLEDYSFSKVPQDRYGDYPTVDEEMRDLNAKYKGIE